MDIEGASQELAQLKVPPHSDEAEEAVIGGLLIDNITFDSLVGQVSADDFYRREYKTLFKTIVSLADEGRPFDTVTVIDYLRKTDALADAGGEAFIKELVGRTLSSANLSAYASLIRDKSILRQMIHAGHHISELGYFPKNKGTSTVLDLAEQYVFNIADKYQNDRNDEAFANVKTLAASALERIRELSNQGSSITGTSTGWEDLDNQTSGLQKGDLIIVAARPSMGKTAFCLNIATNIALEEKKNVAIFSLEMPGEQLVLRMMASLGQIDQTLLRTGKLQTQDWRNLKSALNILAGAPIFINDSFALSPTELRLKCRRLVRENGPLGVIIVDYLQLMEIKESNESRVNQVSEISRSLKMLAKEFNCPVIALSQLNRSLEQRQDKRPILSDLRESGAIEQDADVIMFIYRDAVYAGENEARQDDKTAEIIIGKQRNGPIGTIRLTFIGKYTKFVDYASMRNDVPFDM